MMAIDVLEMTRKGRATGILTSVTSLDGLLGLSFVSHASTLPGFIRYSYQRLARRSAFLLAEYTDGSRVTLATLSDVHGLGMLAESTQPAWQDLDQNGK